MTLPLLGFLMLAALAVTGAISLILQRHPIHSALSLIVVMVALAGLYLMLGAEFVAAVQVIVYAGAIMVLFVFVIMLLNAAPEERTNMSRAARYAGLPLACVLLITLTYAVTRASFPLTEQAAGAQPIRSMSLLLFRNFVFPFELTSILILIAIIGALVLAKRTE
jgi:NADH-quinone oxidoreductase subunit J